MVIAVFPAAKLGALLLKQISKPIASAVKTQAKNSPVFRKYVCLPPAQFYNWCEVKAKMWLLKMGQPVNISVLNEASSIELGANLLGEGVIFFIAATLLVAEYNRGARKEAAKEAARKAEIEALQNDLRDLFIQTEEQGAHIRELMRKIGDLDTLVQKSTDPKKESPPEDPPREPPTISVPQKDSSLNVNDSVDVSPTNLCQDARLDKYRPLENRLSSGVIFKALSEVEREFLYVPDKKREPGVLTTALNLLYQDVYRLPQRF